MAESHIDERCHCGAQFGMQTDSMYGEAALLTEHAKWLARHEEACPQSPERLREARESAVASIEAQLKHQFGR